MVGDRSEPNTDYRLPITVHPVLMTRRHTAHDAVRWDILVTTAPEPTMLPLPMVTRPGITARKPIHVVFNDNGRCCILAGHGDVEPVVAMIAGDHPARRRRS